MKRFFSVLFAAVYLLNGAAFAGTGVGATQPQTPLPVNTILSVPTQLIKLRKCITNVLDQVADCHILIEGDSTSFGLGSTLSGTFPNAGSWPTRLAQLLNTTILPVANGLAVPLSQLSLSPDNRWNVNGWFILGGCAANNSSFVSVNTNPLTFTSGVLADTYTVLVGQRSSTSLTITATGGTPVIVDTSTLPAGLSKIVVTAATAATTNTVTLVSANGNAATCGVIPSLSTKKQILVDNAGVVSSTTGNWSTISSAGGGTSVVDFATAINADVVLISLGLNDFSQPVGNITPNVQNIISWNKTIGSDIILMDFPPSGGNPAYQPIFSAAYKQLAQANNIYFASIFNRFGAFLPTFMSGDTVHPNNSGYWDWARYVVEFINAN